MTFEEHTLVLLRRPADSPEFSEVELEELQERHLAHLAAMGERGAIAASGPFVNQTDESLRGLCVYTVPAEEARRLAEQDPSVKARRLAVDVVSWLAPPGRVRFAEAAGG